MRTNQRIRLLACAGVMLSFMLTPVVHAKKVALVIGNANYGYSGNDWASINGPDNDAMALKRSLTGFGFEVISLVDARRDEMVEGISAFRSKLAPGDMAFFYYSGHGFQTDDQQSYLVPTSAEPTRDDYVLKSQSIALNDVLQMLEKAETGLNVVVLDACRDNPTGKGLGRLGARPIQVHQVQSQTFMAYATSPDTVAASAETPDRLSPFTSAVISAMETHGDQKVQALFDQSIKLFSEQSVSSYQRPWVSSNLYQDWYLADASRASSVPQQPSAESIPVPVYAHERKAEESLKVTDQYYANMIQVSSSELDADVWVGRYYVTQGEYFDFVRSMPLKKRQKLIKAFARSCTGDKKIRLHKAGAQLTHFPKEVREACNLNRNEPITHINFNEAKAYTRWLSKRTGRHYRLISPDEIPSSARDLTHSGLWEWTGACANGNGGAYVKAGTEYNEVCGRKLLVSPDAPYGMTDIGMRALPFHRREGDIGFRVAMDVPRP